MISSANACQTGKRIANSASLKRINFSLYFFRAIYLIVDERELLIPVIDVLIKILSHGMNNSINCSDKY